jgi:hypothetical protein
MEYVIKHLQYLRRKARAEAKKLETKRSTVGWDWDSDRDQRSELTGEIYAYSVAVVCLKHEMKVEEK